MSHAPWQRWDDELTVGAIYQVGDCWIGRTGNPTVSIVGRERSIATASFGFRVGYNANRFRPAFDDGELIADKSTTPQTVDA